MLYCKNYGVSLRFTCRRRHLFHFGPMLRWSYVRHCRLRIEFKHDFWEANARMRWPASACHNRRVSECPTCGEAPCTSGERTNPHDGSRDAGQGIVLWQLCFRSSGESHRESTSVQKARLFSCSCYRCREFKARSGVPVQLFLSVYRPVRPHPTKHFDFQPFRASRTNTQFYLNIFGVFQSKP